MYQNDIADMEGLNNLVRVNGHLIVADHFALKNFTSLEKLLEIGGELLKSIGYERFYRINFRYGKNIQTDSEITP